MTGLPKETFDRIGGGGGDLVPLGPRASASGITHPQPWLLEWAGGRSGHGIAVNEWSAFNYAALFTAISLVARTVATLPCKAFRRRPDGGQDEVADHPVSTLLGLQYNPNTAAMTGRQTEVGHLLSWGNAYTQVVRARNGELLELRPVGPDVVCVEADDSNRLRYVVRAFDRERESRDDVTLTREQVVHVPYFSFDALAGASPVRIARGTIRGGLAQDRQAERFVTKGFRSAGVIKLPPGKRFKDKAELEQFRAGVESVHNQEESESKVMILQDGGDWVSVGVNPEAAQLLESRKFTRQEIAGLYHIPPHLLGDVEKNTSWGSGIEELNIGFVVYCLLPILRQIEQERTRKLFRPDLLPADRGLFVEHNLAGLLRGDSKKQAETIQIYINLGVLAVNEARRLLGFNPAPGGNVRFFPLNMGRINSDTGEDLPPPEQPAGKRSESPTDNRTAAALRKTLSRGLARCLRKEAAEACKAAKRPGEFVGWIDEFYSRHAEQVRELFDTDLTVGFADRHVERSRNDLLAASECRPAELVERVTAAVDKWHADRVADLVAELQGELAHAV